MKKIMLCATLVLLAVSAGFAQKSARRNSAAARPKPVIFAVMDDGKTLEPIGEIDKGELVQTTGGDADAKDLTKFANAYYKPKTAYSLIFGGAANGTVTIKSSNVKSECGKNLANVITLSSKARLKGDLMALATNETAPKNAPGVRRMPTAAERAEIETLVRAEFSKQNVAADVLKNLHYYNLTALDADNDGKAEMVGSFWVESSAKERNLLFFIAEKDESGKYNFGYSDYAKVTPDQVMSGNLKDLDALGGELLLDALAYDGDKTAEIFTVVRSFEGSNFHVYSRKNGKWTRVFEGYNYHCAF